MTCPSHANGWTRRQTKRDIYAPKSVNGSGHLFYEEFSDEEFNHARAKCL
jgi:hypothetical protein